MPYFGGGSTKIAPPKSTPQQAADACNEAGVPAALPSTYAGRAGSLIGAWAACAMPVSAAPPYAGLVLDADGSWHWLAIAGGAFERSTDCEASGIWGLDTALLTQIDMYFDPGSHMYLVQSMTTSPTTIVLDDGFGTTQRFVRLE